MPLDPVSELRIYNPRDLFGYVSYEGEHVTWDLLASLGQTGAAMDGFVPDPTGQYVMQSPVSLWQDAGNAQWTPGAGDNGTYTHGKDAATGKLSLIQSNPAATVFKTTLGVTRTAEEGFSCELWRAATVAGALYLHFSAGRTAGTPGLRLAIEAGKFIRLQCSSDDDATWRDFPTGIASELGESETCLNGSGRYLSVDVLPQTDPDWIATTDSPFPPPGQIVVTLNGGASVLTFPAPTLSAGALKVTGTLGQWAVTRYAKKVFTLAPTASLPAQTRARPFQGEPRIFVTGYAPFAGMIDAEVTTTDGSAGSTDNAAYGGLMQVLSGSTASATLALAVPVEGQITAGGGTYATRTAYLSALESAWDAIQVAPMDDPPYVSYAPIYAKADVYYDQGRRFVRRRAICILQALDDSFSPGFVVPAVRAARLYMGDAGDEELTPVITGWTALDSVAGQEWSWVDWSKHFAIVIEDRFRKGDDDQTVCLHMEPFDFQAHYYPVRFCLYKLGITDEWMSGFPDVGANGELAGGGTFDGYYLGGGTAAQPLWQPAPDESINSFLLKIAERAGEVDPTSGTIQPMILGTLPDGEIVYLPMLAGIAESFLTPGQTLENLGLASAADYLLSDFVKGGLRTKANLSNIRTPVVVEGIDRGGNIVVGIAANESVGIGTDMSVPGGVWTNVPFVNISRLNSSLEVVQRAAAVAAVTMAFPSISMEGRLNFLNPSQDALQILTVTDPYTMGSYGPVPFYADAVSHVVDCTSPAHHVGETSFTGRLIALAGTEASPTGGGTGEGGTGDSGDGFSGISGISP